MTAAAAAELAANRATPAQRRSTVVGGVLVFLAAIMIWVFAAGVSADATSRFNLSLPNDTVKNLSLSFNSRWLSIIAAIIVAALAAERLARRRLEFTNRALGIGLAVFILSFLAWAAADGSFSMVGMLQSMVVSSIVIVLGALTGVVCERSGVINIGIEGQLLAAAFVAVVFSSAYGTIAGVAAGMAIGALLGWMLAWLSIRFQVDQIIAGVVINIFALGLTSFLAGRILTEAQDLNAPARVKAWRIPLLADIPVVGPMFFNHNFFIYGTFLLVGGLHFGLFRTRWGLRTRSIGEHPKAADTLGIDVLRLRYLNVAAAGLIAGFGGAFLGISQVSRFESDMTGGIGFIGLAAMIFGRWRPFGALAAGLVFGFSGALAQKVSILGTGIPSEFMLMLPYIATVVVVAGLVGDARAPAADGQPYTKN